MLASFRGRVCSVDTFVNKFRSITFSLSEHNDTLVTKAQIQLVTNGAMGKKKFCCCCCYSVLVIGDNNINPGIDGYQNTSGFDV